MLADVRLNHTPGLSPSDCVSDPEEKEVSEGEDEDDDRNHKHRKKETRSHSLERGALDQVFTRPYRKRNKPFENGYIYGGGDSQSGGTLSARFEKRRLNPTSFSGIDLKYRNRGNQLMSGEAGPVRGRGREPSSWGLRDSRFGSSDIASQLVQPGNMHSSLFSGRGLPNVSNAQSTSWNAFGLVPGISNGALDALHPLGFQGTLRPSISPAMNIVIPRQRCRDFEERGFCLRGDMCPMEHGVNRIVVEDVQSLSQFNLPVSLPGSQLLGTPAGQGTLPAVNAPAPSGTLMNGRTSYKSSKLAMTDDGLGLNALLGLNPSNVDDTESFFDTDPSDHQQIRFSEVFDDEHPTRNAATAGSHNSSVWGRIGSSRNRSGPKEKIDSSITSSTNLETDSKDLEPLNTGSQDASDHGKWMNVNQNGPQFKEMSFKQQCDSGHNVRKSSHKALRTLFVKGIPLKDNKKEALLSHFQKFGKVIDIYIPLNSERAFVQFSKREEAEAALKAPDAVMGNRFIKLWWANRDNIPDDGVARMVMPYPSVAQVLAYDHPKPIVSSSPKAPPPLQNKLESLELLKEELRKKQLMLDQKRNDFRRQLDKLEKHATGLKDVKSDLATKRLKGETLADPAEAETSGSPPRTNEPPSSRPLIRPLAPLGARAPFMINRFKLDNRPTSFRVVSPLPDGLANVAALEEYFSSYGDLSSVELEESQPQETSNASLPSCVAARVSFTTRHSAEKAFLNGKCWQGHNLQFMWITSSNSRKNIGGAGNSPAPPDRPSDANVQSSGEDNSSKNIGGSGDCAASSDRPSDANVQSSGEDNIGGSGDCEASSDRPSDANVQSSGEDNSSKNIGGSGDCDANVQSSGEVVYTHEKPSALGSDESENPKKERDIYFVNQDKDSKSSSTTISGEEQST
ncbi:Zinc finger CCCH domain-containing protein 41 [Forsythia ovata]|uniref:Zinc finger CCCH domain-containing protein 41 n=1 Tax=Forsythia ovata TaxID=205694 RepID=A0ABD1WUS6_9LAMI